MVFLICLVLAEFLPFTYTAPKLGHVLFDPLSYEAAMFVKKDVPSSTLSDALRRFLGVKDKADEIAKKPCLGYDYDDKLCKLLNDRIICGYNKNLGQPKDSETVIDIGNGCFIRGDRIECDYVTEPYENFHQASQSEKVEKIKPAKLVETTKARQERKNLMRSSAIGQSISTRTTNSSPTTSTISSTTTMTTTVPTRTTVASSTPTSTTTTTVTTKTPRKTSEQNTTAGKSKFMCVDKNNSVFCYEIKEANYFIS